MGPRFEDRPELQLEHIPGLKYEPPNNIGSLKRVRFGAHRFGTSGEGTSAMAGARCF